MKFMKKSFTTMPGIFLPHHSLRLCSNVPAQLAIYQIHDDQSFILELLKNTQVLAVQGSGFNWPEPDHFRLVFLPDIDTLKTASDRIEQFLNNLRRSEM
jgi:alanine-synthesizing transaminase